jgi:HAE1 family hydrophobic/amphiphilic exporter-1
MPAAFLPGLTGRMFAQFALVIAVTALISAVNALTLKPTQCAVYLRTPVPMEKRNFFYRGFNKVYGRLEDAYAGLIGQMTHLAIVMVIVALVVVGVAGWGLGRLPTAFLPNEDQGYAFIALQLPDGASLERTQRAMAEATKIALATPGVDTVVEISGVSVLDNSATLSNAGVAYVILKDWGVREKAAGQDLRSILEHIQGELAKLPDATGLVLIPPPIQGIGNAGGFNMMVELRDGNVDFPKLERISNQIVANANGQSELQHVATTFRAQVPQVEVLVDRVKAETLQVSVNDVFSAMSAYLGSSFVNQFNKFGHVFQVYVQADSKYRITPRDIESLYVKSKTGAMVPLGTLVTIKDDVGPALVTLYNLYPAATIIGGPATGYSSGQAMALMDELANKTLPPGTGFDWTAMSYQELVVGNSIYYSFGLAILLVYLCLAGQYESWLAPMSVILAVPLALIGPVITLNALGVPNNLYVQIGLMLLIALAAKNAILIVEVAREHRILHGETILEAAVNAARIRFRPILMTSFAFILGVLPLVLAKGAGAASRVSLGLTVFSGMIASTCLAVLFVPSFFVVMQRIEESRQNKKNAKKGTPPAALPDTAD